MGHRPPATRRSLFGPKWIGVSVIALFAGMLFWSKLRVSSVVPRSAFAVPEAGDETSDDRSTTSDPDADSPYAESPEPVAD